ncbi:MAG: hypothetical protein OWR52_05055 [Acidibacillus sp.]|nr:hypothetical protein [Acidibacillus sp.]
MHTNHQQVDKRKVKKNPIHNHKRSHVKSSIIRLMAVTSVTTLLLTGCWDNHELESLAFVTVLGIDEGKHDNLKITYQYFTPTTEAPKVHGAPLITTFEAPSFGLAENIANVTTDRMITSQQLKVTMIGEKFGKKNDVARVLEGMVRSRTYRRDIMLITSIESANTTIRANRSKLGSTSLDFIENMRNQHSFTGLMPVETLNDFLVANESGDRLAYTALVAINKPAPLSKMAGEDVNREAGQFSRQGGDDKVEFAGAEIYRGDRAAGRLTGQEARILLMLKHEVKTFLVGLRDPIHKERRNTLLIHQFLSPRVSAHLDKGRLHFIINVPLDATLDSSTAELNYVQDVTLRHKLEKQFNHSFEQETIDLIKRCQTEFKGDPFGLAYAIKWRFLTENDWKKFNYTKHFNEARFTVYYDVQISNFGKQRAPYGSD